MLCRAATTADVPQLVRLGQRMHDESKIYGHYPLNIEKGAYIFNSLLSTPNDDLWFDVIDRDDGDLRGMIIAERVEDLWTQATVTSDHLIFVDKEVRNSLIAGRFLLRLLHWADKVPGIVRITANAGLDDVHAGKVFTKAGLGFRGTVHGKETI